MLSIGFCLQTMEKEINRHWTKISHLKPKLAPKENEEEKAEEDDDQVAFDCEEKAQREAVDGKLGAASSTIEAFKSSLESSLEKFKASYQSRVDVLNDGGNRATREETRTKLREAGMQLSETLDFLMKEWEAFSVLPKPHEQTRSTDDESQVHPKISSFASLVWGCNKLLNCVGLIKEGESTQETKEEGSGEPDQVESGQNEEGRVDRLVLVSMFGANINVQGEEEQQHHHHPMSYAHAT
eukprot:GHVU01009530.1.p1 GENE.GHVU01009530.1~~GHVU01009530.1.p1  ORF type:complete len:240 (-),score=38.43 GHVU01009530.1:1206-1925(-)